MQKYRHYKNNKTYTVLYEAWDTSKKDWVIVYRGEYTCPEFGKYPIFTRPKNEFFETVFDGNGREVKRFKEI